MALAYIEWLYEGFRGIMSQNNNAGGGTTDSADGVPVTQTTTSTSTTTAETVTTTSNNTPFTSSSPTSHSHSAHIERVAIKPPPFWRTSPKLWFSHLEAQFITGSIVSDETKYYYVVAALEEQMLKLVSDIVERPPTQNKYQTLRDSLIKILSDSEAQRLQKLLKGMDLGDQKPSQLLRQMRSSNDFSLQDSVLKNLWLQRLPQQAQIVLAASPGSLDDLALLADKIMEAFNPSNLYEMSNKNEQVRPNTEISSLEAKLDELLKHVSLVDKPTINRNRDRSSSRPNYSRNRSNSPKSPTTTKEYKYCWYHFRFGADATKCNSPCQFKASKN